MFNNIKSFILDNKLTAGLIAGILIVLIGGFFAFQQIIASKKNVGPLQEVDLNFDPEGPYALLEPRRDGNALILNIKRVGGYDKLSYEMAYSSTGSTAGEEFGTDSVDRGVQGTISEGDKKSEYSQEILFGTCSRSDTISLAHCVFDKGVENGTLNLKIQKESILYRMHTTWHIQKPDVALGKITSGDDHFRYETVAQRQELANVGFTIVNDLTGVPKLPAGKQVIGKVYAFNVPVAKEFPAGNVTIELAENPPANSQIARFVESKNDWEMLETKVDGSTLTAKATGAGIFAVFSPVQ